MNGIKKEIVLFSIFLNIDETYVLKLTDLIKGPKTSHAWRAALHPKSGMRCHPP
jgi:hypothetical protein